MQKRINKRLNGSLGKYCENETLYLDPDMRANDDTPEVLVDEEYRKMLKELGKT
jgi:hypothetical protein